MGRFLFPSFKCFSQRGGWRGASQEHDSKEPSVKAASTHLDPQHIHPTHPFLSWRIKSNTHRLNHGALLRNNISPLQSESSIVIPTELMQLILVLDSCLWFSSYSWLKANKVSIGLSATTLAWLNRLSRRQGYTRLEDFLPRFPNSDLSSFMSEQHRFLLPCPALAWLSQKTWIGL